VCVCMCACNHNHTSIASISFVLPRLHVRQEKGPSELRKDLTYVCTNVTQSKMPEMHASPHIRTSAASLLENTPLKATCISGAQPHSSAKGTVTDLMTTQTLADCAWGKERGGGCVVCICLCDCMGVCVRTDSPHQAQVLLMYMYCPIHRCCICKITCSWGRLREVSAMAFERNTFYTL